MIYGNFGAVAGVLLSFSTSVSAASITPKAEERANYFNDPFLQVTNGISACPVPEGPLLTKAEMLALDLANHGHEGDNPENGSRYWVWIHRNLMHLFAGTSSIKCAHRPAARAAN